MANSQNIILITGAAGFLGRHLSQYYFKQGWCVIGIDRLAKEDQMMKYLSSYHQIQLPDPMLGSILKSQKFNLCVHCAGSSSISKSLDDPREDFYTSTVVTFELLNAMRLYAHDCHLVYLSSAAVYGNPDVLPIEETNTKIQPLSPYGFHKYQCEQICAEFASIYGMHTASARVFSAYGVGLRRQVVWDIFQKAISKSQFVLQGTGTESRDFIYVSDVVHAIDCITTNAPMEGEAYNVANGVEVSIGELANLILSNISPNSTIEYDGSVPKGVPLNWCSNNSKLRSIGFNSSVPLKKGVLKFLKWAETEVRKQL